MPGHSCRRGNKLYLAPPSQQTPGVELPTQQPPVDELPTQQGAALLSASADDDDDDVLPIMGCTMFEDPDLDDTAPSCVAGLLCCNPNSDTDEYCLCMNCNGEAHTICTEHLNFQAPADDKLVITPKDFCNMGKERFKKTPLSHHQNVVFCLLCKARMIQKKLHLTKKLTIKQKASSSDLGATRKSKKGKILGPSAALLHNLRKVAAYHCQTTIFTVVNKTSEKAKHAAIEEAFHGNVSKNIIGGSQQLVDGDHAFANLYNNYEDDDGNARVLKASCCGADTTSIYVAGRDFMAESLLSFGNGKNFQGRAIWKMADSVMTSLKKALSLVPQLSPKLVMINTTCRVVGYASRKNEALFMKTIDHGMYVLDKKDKKGFLSADDDEQLGLTKRILNVDSGDGDDDVDDPCNGDESVVVVLDSDSNDEPVDSWVLDSDSND
jgi:hypothetical protein